MATIQNINKDWIYVGANNRRLKLFENIYPIPRGVSYNSYLLIDDKTVLMDTCDASVQTEFLNNISTALNGRALDYLVIQHMEPDHCALIVEILKSYPQIQLVCNAKTLTMIRQFFDLDVTDKTLLVKEGDKLETGHHTLSFIMAPMVHWPEVMMTYDATDKILFSADAFGSFNAIDGNLFADEVDYEREWLPDMRRYYANIVGKYGAPVQTVLKKAANLDIQTICPLHGLIWRKNLTWLLDKHQKWSTYTPEEKGVVIACGSIYGHTEEVANLLAFKLAQHGINNIRVYDVSRTHPSWIVSESFRVSHLVFACSSYNAGIFPPMETALLDIKAHALCNRTVALIENGSWALCAKAQMKAILETLKGITFIGEGISIRSAMKPDQEKELDLMADELAKSLKDQK
ncbi:MAG: FprA family A-type flavoprotein [Alphaproteobacteria bacterium]|nr:FprA family A-type flavoprotein [Alphaproteobacteria bacterium]